MSADIGPGTWVECIDDRPNSLGEPVPLVLRAIYCVAAVVEAIDADGTAGTAVVLREIQPAVRVIGDELWAEAFAVSRFRPVYRPPTSFIDSFLQPAPERALEDA